LEPTKLLEELFDRKRMILVKLFLDHPEQEYGIREAAKAAKLAPATSYRIIRTLLKLGLVEERRVKRLRLYRAAQNRETRFLDELLAVRKTAIEEFVEFTAQLAGVAEIILHGKPTKEKASILVIGENVDASALSRIVGDIKVRLNFTILHLVLAPHQYAQMTDMGLYAGEKQILYTHTL
jgi:DNA-binding transcriptional ArsR family regulator